MRRGRAIISTRGWTVGSGSAPATSPGSRAKRRPCPSSRTAARSCSRKRREGERTAGISSPPPAGAHRPSYLCRGIGIAPGSSPPAEGRCYMQVEDSQTGAPVATPLKIGPGSLRAARAVGGCRLPCAIMRAEAPPTAPTAATSTSPARSSALLSPPAPPPPPPFRSPPLGGWAAAPPALVQPFAISPQPRAWARVPPASPPTASEDGRVVDLRVERRRHRHRESRPLSA